MSYHEIELLGRLGNAPQLRHTPSGAAVASFNVATTQHLTNADGTRGEETIWWRVSAWNKQGENAARYLVKGQEVFIKGQLKVDSQTGKPGLWTDQAGETRVNLEITANRIVYGAKPQNGQNGQRGHYNQVSQPQAANPPRYPEDSEFDSRHRDEAAQRLPSEQRHTTDTSVPYSHHRGGGVAPRSPQQSQRSRSQPQQYSRRQPAQSQNRIQDVTPDEFGPDEIPF